MRKTALHTFLLGSLLAGSTVLYLPFADDPFRSFREALFQAVAAGLIFLHLAYPGGKDEPVPRNTAFKWPMVFFGVGAGALTVSFYVNGVTPLGAMAVANFLLAGVVFAALYAALTPARAPFWLTLFFATALMNATLGVAQFFGHDPFFKSLDPAWHTQYPRYLVGGFLDSPNMLAPFLASFVPYLFVLFLTEGNGRRTALAGSGLALLLLPVALTKNVSALAGLAVVVPVLLAYFTFRLKARRGRLVLCWLAAVIVAIGAMKAYSAEDESTKTLRAQSRDERLAQNRAALMMFEQSPAFGKGPGFFNEHFVEYRRAVWFDHPPLRLPDRPAHQTHNDYTQLLAEGGLMAALPVFAILLLWLWMQGRFFMNALRAVEISPRETLLAGAAGGFWVIAVNALGNFPFHVATLAVTALFWAALAARQLEEPTNG